MMKLTDEAADTVPASVRPSSERLRDIGIFLAGCGLLLLGLAAMIYVFRGPPQSNYDRLAEESMRRGMQMFEASRGRP
jgi:hypothetical protein